MYDRDGNPVSPEDVLSPEELADYYRSHPQRDPRRQQHGEPMVLTKHNLFAHMAVGGFDIFALDCPLCNYQLKERHGNRVHQVATGDAGTRAGGGAQPLAEEEQQGEAIGEGGSDG